MVSCKTQTFLGFLQPRSGRNRSAEGTVTGLSRAARDQLSRACERLLVAPAAACSLPLLPHLNKSGRHVFSFHPDATLPHTAFASNALEI